MSTDGVVKLKGTVNSAQKKAKAEEIACKVDGAPCAFTLFDTHAKLLQFSKKTHSSRIDSKYWLITELTHLSVRGFKMLTKFGCFSAP